MRIQVLSTKQDTTSKGNLLEKFVKKFLEIQNFHVEGNIRNTGVEIDLLCTNKANGSKSIYIECKAYAPKSLIQSETVMKLMGIRSHKKYSEAWLISTSDFGKDAKGLIGEIGSGDDASHFTFYSPQKLIEALIAANKIRDSKSIFDDISLRFNNKVDDDPILLISDYGEFWLFPYMVGGVGTAVITLNASNGSQIIELALLENLKKLDTEFKSLDFTEIALSDAATQRIHTAEPVNETLELSGEYLSNINDIGVKFTHPSKDQLVLDDVFIYPDLEDLNRENVRISSKELFATDYYPQKTFIFGDDVSGKTSLAYQLQKEASSIGRIAIYLNAEEIKSSDPDKFLKLLSSIFKKQYGDSPSKLKSQEALLSTEKIEVILIIDNFEKLGIKRSQSVLDLLTMLDSKYVNIFILGNLSLELEALAKSEMRVILENFAKYRIKQCGHVLRDNLIDKWLTIGYGEDTPENELLNRKDEITEKIKVIVGTNFLPTYPLYLLTMLQLIEADNKNKLQGSSYAELYRYIINQSLGSVNIRPDDLDFYHTYLSHIAHYFFAENIREISKEDMVDIYTNYGILMDVEKPFDTVHEHLIKAKILKSESGSYSFNHNYGYYFFAAKYLAENISEEKIRAEIKNLTSKLYRKEYANIVIFLIHHSKNKDIIKDIVSESKRLFEKIAPSTLSDKELLDTNSLIREEIRVSITDQSPQEHRRKNLEQQDKLDEAADQNSQKNEASEEDPTEALDLFGKINLAFKLIEILGQIAKSYYGSLDANSKTEVLEEAEALGLRALRALLEDFQKYVDSIRTDVLEVIEKKDRKNKAPLTDVEKNRISDTIIFGFTEILVIVFLKRISDSVASKNLFVTLDRIAVNSDSPATQLINLAARLNFPGELRQKKIVEYDNSSSQNHLVKRLIRFLVIEHLYRFDVPYSDKQSICAALGIDYKQNKRYIQKKLSGG